MISAKKEYIISKNYRNRARKSRNWKKILMFKIGLIRRLFMSKNLKDK
jgi:hypothetical protein